MHNYWGLLWIICLIRVSWILHKNGGTSVLELWSHRFVAIISRFIPTGIVILVRDPSIGLIRPVLDNEMFTSLTSLWRYFWTIFNWRPYLLNRYRYRITQQQLKYRKSNQPTNQPTITVFIIFSHRYFLETLFWD